MNFFLTTSPLLSEIEFAKIGKTYHHILLIKFIWRNFQSENIGQVILSE